MEEEILNILKYYEDNGLEADYTFVKEILKILRKHCHAEDFLKSLVVYKGKGKITFGGAYIPYYMKIVMDLNLHTQLKNIKTKNVYILWKILHEFEHVLQRKHFIDLIDDEIRIDDVFYKLCLLSNRSKVCSDSNLLAIHEYIPIERLANIKATEEILKILLLDKRRYKEITDSMLDMLYDFLICGYDFEKQEVYPLRIYNDLLKDNDKRMDGEETVLSILDKEDALSINKRVLYGLPINIGEFNRVVSNYRRVLSKKVHKTRVK